MALSSGAWRPVSVLCRRVLSSRAFPQAQRLRPAARSGCTRSSTMVSARKVGERVKLGGRARRSDPTSLEKAMDIAARLPLPSEEPKGEGDAPQGAGLVPRDIGDVLNGLN